MKNNSFFMKNIFLILIALAIVLPSNCGANKLTHFMATAQNVLTQLATTSKPFIDTVTSSKTGALLLIGGIIGYAIGNSIEGDEPLLGGRGNSNEERVKARVQLGSALASGIGITFLVRNFLLYNNYKHLLSVKTGLGLFVGGVIINFIGKYITTKERFDSEQGYNSQYYNGTHIGKHTAGLGQYITACGSALFFTKIMAKNKRINQTPFAPEICGYFITAAIPPLIETGIKHYYGPDTYPPDSINLPTRFFSKVARKACYLPLAHALIRGAIYTYQQRTIE